MRMVRAVALAAAVAAGSAVAPVAGAVPAGAQDEATVEITSVRTADHPQVTAVVSAPGGLDGGNYPAEAFTLLEDGAPVDARVERVPTNNLEIMLVLDTSGSMEGAPLAGAQQAAKEFLVVLPPEVRVGVVGFGPSPQVLAAPTADRVHLAQQIDGLVASGETALYDALVHAAGQFTPAATDRAVVLLSDGGDTASAATLPQAVEAAGTVPVNVIDLVTDESNPEALAQLAGAGGGAVSSATDPAALGQLYQATAGALVNRYRLTYTSAAQGDAELTVRVRAEGGVLEHTRKVEMPAPSPAPTTTERAGPAGGEAAAARDTEGSHLGLPLGAGAVFAALLVLGLVVVLGDGRPRVAALHLGSAPMPSGPPSVSQVTQRMSAAADTFLDRRGRRQGLATALEVAGISLRTGEFVVLVGAITVVAALAAVLVAGLLGLVAVAVLVPLGASVVVGRLAERRRRAFADRLPDNLQLLSGSLRSGYGLLQALDVLAREAAEPAGGEFRRVLLEIRVGRDPGAALGALADRMQSDDFTWVVAAIDINREVGGDLATVLDNVAGTIRERQRLFRQMRALTAEGRLSAYVLTALPPLLGLFMALINPDYVARLTSGAGLALVAVGTVMLAVGWLWMQRLTRLDF